jgi:hypothetical protein
MSVSIAPVPGAPVLRHRRFRLPDAARERDRRLLPKRPAPAVVVALRSIVLAATAVVLILIALPAALGAAGV